MSRIGVALGITLTFLGVSSPSSAHHGAGVYEPEKMVTLVGTVTEFQFVNPHVLVYRRQERGRQRRALGRRADELNRLARMDGSVKWHKDILKPGDRITMKGHPARNGAPAMTIDTIVNSDGVALIGGN
jgi:hypothetical protein